MAKHFTDVLYFPEGQREEFKKGVTDLLWKIDESDLGEDLLRKITEKCYPEYIAFTGPLTGLPGFCFMEALFGFEFDHEKATFNLHLGYFEARRNRNEPIEPTMLEVVRSNKTYIYLFHELVHCYHYLYDKSYTPDLYEEIRTTGLYDRMNEWYSENHFRKEINFPYRRPCYSFSRTTDGMSRQSQYYDQEAKIRAGHRLPKQELLTKESQECKPNFILGIPLFG